MSTKLEPLLKVKTISRKMVDQIQFAPIDTKPDSLWNQITEGLFNGEQEPIGWVPGALFKNMSQNVGFWLVRHKGRYYWYLCPTYGKLFDLYPHVEQLFV